MTDETLSWYIICVKNAKAKTSRYLSQGLTWYFINYSTFEGTSRLVSDVVLCRSIFPLKELYSLCMYAFRIIIIVSYLKYESTQNSLSFL